MKTTTKNTILLFLRRMADRLERCRILVILANLILLIYTFVLWLLFYIRHYYYKWSKPLWRV